MRLCASGFFSGDGRTVADNSITSTKANCYFDFVCYHFFLLRFSCFFLAMIGDDE